MRNTTFLYNSPNKSIFQSNIIAKNKIKIYNVIIKNKSINFHKLSPYKIKNNNNIKNQKLSPIVKIKNKILSEKNIKPKQTLIESPINHISSESTNNSNNYSNINKLKNLIKFNKEKNINNNAINNQVNFSYEYNSPLTEKRNFYSLSFNEQLNKYLLKNNTELYNKKSLLTFKEKNNIHRKICYLNNYCRNILKGYKKSNYFENLLDNIDKSDKIYNKYKIEINDYLSFIEKQISKEENILEKIISKKLHLKSIINKLYNYIAKNKFIIDECREIKEFLLKVKYGVPDIEDIPKNILALYENESKKIENKNENINININKITSHKNIRNRKTAINPINYPTILVKKLVKPPNNNKNIPNDLNIKDYLNKENNDNLYITPIKYLKNNMNNLKNLNGHIRRDKRMSFRKNNLVSNFNKKYISNINPIFDDPEEFMDRYNELVYKMKKSLEYYNEILFQIQTLKNVDKTENDYLIDEKLEKKSKIILNRLYQDNTILNKKIKLYTKLNNSAGLEEKISHKIKSILLEINSISNIEKQFNISQFESRLENYETDKLQTKAEKNKSKNAFLMEILENILENLMSVDKSYKSNPLYNEQYKKIKAIEENIKLKRIRQKQIDKLKKKQNEKNKKVVENYTKIRFLFLNKKGMDLYHRNNNSITIKKEMEKTDYNSSFNDTSPFLSFSFNGKTNYKQLEKNINFEIKKENKPIIKRDEIFSLLSY